MKIRLTNSNSMKRLSLLFFIGLIVYGCSSSKETQSDNNISEHDYYIFDNVEKIDSVNNDIQKHADNKTDSLQIKSDLTIKKDSLEAVKYFIQLGAFTTKERADGFIQENQGKLSYMMSAIYNTQRKLYVVQLPPFTQRVDAETVRNTLWKIPAFKDAFIITE